MNGRKYRCKAPDSPYVGLTLEYVEDYPVHGGKYFKGTVISETSEFIFAYGESLLGKTFVWPKDSWEPMFSGVTKKDCM